MKIAYKVNKDQMKNLGKHLYDTGYWARSYTDFEDEAYDNFVNLLDHDYYLIYVDDTIFGGWDDYRDDIVEEFIYERGKILDYTNKFINEPITKDVIKLTNPEYFL